MSGAVVAAKTIGEAVETLVVDAVAGLDGEDDEDAHHGAVVTDLLAPSLVETTLPVTWAGTRVEIKACKRWTSNGDHDIRRRWLCKGHDGGQHAALLEAAAVYVLAQHQPASKRCGVSSSSRYVMPTTATMPRTARATRAMTSITALRPEATRRYLGTRQPRLGGVERAVARRDSCSRFGSSVARVHPRRPVVRRRVRGRGPWVGVQPAGLPRVIRATTVLRIKTGKQMPES